MEPFALAGACKVFDLSEFSYGRAQEVVGTYGGYEMRAGRVFVVHVPSGRGYKVKRKATPLALTRQEGAR